MSSSIKIAALASAIAIIAMPAVAQSNFQCVGGELLGGPQGFACETDGQGRIINVQPRAHTEKAPQQRPVQQVQPQGTTVYRGTTRTHVPHQPATRTYTQPRTTTSTTTRTYSYTHAPAPVTRTYTHTPPPAPRTYRHQPTTVYRSHSPAPKPIRPILWLCDDQVTRLGDTRDGRRQYEVCYADLRPLNYRAAEELYSRVSTAARRACRGGHVTGSLISRDRSCRREAIKQAVFDVDSPALDAVYSDKTGRQIPRVRVGRPIYR